MWEGLRLEPFHQFLGHDLLIRITIITDLLLKFHQQQPGIAIQPPLQLLLVSLRHRRGEDLAHDLQAINPHDVARFAAILMSLTYIGSTRR